MYLSKKKIVKFEQLSNILQGLMKSNNDFCKDHLKPIKKVKFAEDLEIEKNILILQKQMELNPQEI